MKKFSTILLIFTGLLVSSCSVIPHEGNHYQPAPGVFDFSPLSNTAAPVKLDGQWSWVPGRLASPAFRPVWDQTEALNVHVPSAWNNYKVSGQPYPAKGIATYRISIIPPRGNGPWALKINSLGSAFQLFVNGQLLAKAGSFSAEEADGVPGYAPQVLALPPSPNGWDIRILVSNWHHKEGGIFYSWFFGSFAALSSMRQNILLLDTFLFGSLLVMGIYNLGLFFFMHRDKSPLFFGLICLVLGLRIVFYGEYFILELIPNLNWEVFQKIGYLTLYLSPPLFYHFIALLFPAELSKKSVLIADLVAAVPGLLTLLLPQFWYSQIQPFYQIWIIFATLFGIFILFKAWRRGRSGSGWFLAGLGVFFLAILNDILHTAHIINTTHLVAYGNLFFIISQSFVLTKKFSTAFHRVDHLSQTLLQTNESLSRFVPTEFLRYLGKTNITEVELGDHKQHSMAVLFADIRSFTKLSERMSPEENFRFINSYLRRISPAIRHNRGFVDKFLGDGLMALFPDGPEDAVRAGLDMLRALDVYNVDRKKSGYRKIRIGIGIHAGDLMMGTIGNDDRMDSTVIADAVNLASRLEGLNKRFGTTILVSLDAMSRMKDPDVFQKRFLGVLPIKGKSLPIPVFEIFEGDAEDLRSEKERTRWAFEAAVQAVIDGNASEAQIRFEALLNEVPGDRATMSYLRRLTRL